MRAVVVESFGTPPSVQDVTEPTCPSDGVIVKVAATGLCRSDWHGWMGHDPDIVLPHVPGHEFAGEVVEVGADVTRRTIGDRVTTPFVCACGRCATCLRGDHQVCEQQEQPGFTHWGSFAEYVVVDVADVNAVALPESLDFDTAASLGCRFATAYRAVVSHARVRHGDWTVVHGCGGVGLSAVMIAVAAGAQVIAVDPTPAARERALALGAEHALASAEAVGDLTDGGARASVDAVGGVASMLASIGSLRPRGRHVQVGLLGGAGDIPVGALSTVIARELEFLGSHGMSAVDYDGMLARVTSGEFDLGGLVRRRIGLADAAVELAALGSAQVDGITVINP